MSTNNENTAKEIKAAKILREVYAQAAGDFYPSAEQIKALRLLADRKTDTPKNKSPKV